MINNKKILFIEYKNNNRILKMKLFCFIKKKKSNVNNKIFIFHMKIRNMNNKIYL